MFVNRAASSWLRGLRDQHSDTGIEELVPRIPASSTLFRVEYDMKMGSASLFGRLCCGLSLAVLAFAVSLDGARAVRADDADDLTASLQEMIVDPIMKAVHGLDERLASLEVTVGGMAEQLSSQRVVARMLCVADESGAQTCITKAQLDSLLSGVAHAEISRPAVAVKEAKAVAAEQPAATVITKDPARAPDLAGSADEKSVADGDPEHTGTIAASGDAIVLYPEVEIVVVPAPAAPAESDAAAGD
jgi:hypothetical protein